jgi:hypothetical protein
MCCEAEAGAPTPKVRPCRTPRQNQPKPHRTAVVLVALCVQTCANRCKPVQTSANLFVAFLKALLLAVACGLSALWARAGVHVLRTHSPGGKTLPKITIGLVRGEGGAPSPVGPQVGGGCEEAGLHVQAELRWGWGVAWGRPRAPARAPASPARSPCPGAESSVHT